MMIKKQTDSVPGSQRRADASAPDFIPGRFSLGVVFALLLCLLFSVSAQARPHKASAKRHAKQAAAAKKHATAKAAAKAPTGPTTLKLHSRYAVLVDGVTGKVLWGRNENAERAMASTTKMMTAILLLERGHLDDIVTAPNAVKGIPESSLHLSPGEKLTLHDLLYAMLLRSANDTAVAGATYLSGSVPAFVAEMNKKAQEIGATHTHFVTPNGLYAKEHYSTAADLAKIACYATNNLPEFNAIVRTPKYKITRSMHVHDEWVKNTSYTFLTKFPGGDGIKTGYVSQAGHCFVGSATRSDPQGRPWRLVAVALNSPICRQDVEAMLNYGFANFAPTVAVPKDAPLGQVNVPTAAAPVPVIAAKEVRAVVSRWKPIPTFQTKVVPLPNPPQAPVWQGTKLGTVTVLANGKPQATADVVAAQNVPLRPALALAKTGKAVGRHAFPLFSGLLGVLLFSVLGRFFYAHSVKKGRGSRARRNTLGRTAPKSPRERRNRLAPDVRRVD